MNNKTPQEHIHQDKIDGNRVVSEKTLAEQVAILPNEMMPERDLWPGIERAINQKSQENYDIKKSNVFIPSAWAASIAMVMLMSWFTFSPAINEQSTSALVKNNEQVNPSSGQLVNFMQQSFKQQKQTLLASYGQPSLETLPAAMQIELTQLADARASIRKALLTDENNVDLLNLLDFTQQQELKLLQQLYRQYQVI
ncbi:hypothetical protein [Colwellia psychrerythraea]|uniref:Uncharacterized protein n=1 Tax=Colwellia psychrerythraea TaxID=28229 RepID=A0A099KLN0_COLPS|nr:hypothetical protein [Colwellia psychrerythraea]KGJ91110.1 hypothetical protein GAB14E_3262 [Colwellia psychrerythraea]